MRPRSTTGIGLPTVRRPSRFGVRSWPRPRDHRGRVGGAGLGEEAGASPRAEMEADECRRLGPVADGTPQDVLRRELEGTIDYEIAGRIDEEGPDHEQRVDTRSLRATAGCARPDRSDL